MNKKIFFTLSLLSMLVLLNGCGGGGSGGALTVPPGTNVGIPSIVKLIPAKYVAQTHSYITLSAKVLDGNGLALPNITVYFSNLSTTGVLSASSAITDSRGIAEVVIGSATEGFASVVIAVGNGSGQIRDTKTVFFTSTLSMNLAPTMQLDVDGDNDGIYNEAGDFVLFEGAGDTQVLIRATVRNSFDLLVSGVTVTFGADFPFKVGSDPAASCSDGSTTCEVIFPLGNTATTDFNGRAYILVQASPTVLRSIATVLNVTAIADIGAFNMISLFLNPVTVSTVTVAANPTTVESAGTSTITAAVMNSAGSPVPDGTTVTFTANNGGALDTPFAQTEGGVAKAELTAPTVTSDTTVTVTASVGGKSGSASVLVTAAAVTPPPSVATAITPATISVTDGGDPQTVVFVVSGGNAPYTVSSSNPNVAFNDDGAAPNAGNGTKDADEGGTWDVATNGGTVTVTIPANAVTADTVVTLIAVSTGGGTPGTATLTIKN